VFRSHPCEMPTMETILLVENVNAFTVVLVANRRAARPPWLENSALFPAYDRAVVEPLCSMDIPLVAVHLKHNAARVLVHRFRWTLVAADVTTRSARYAVGECLS
jgi:hypothetical protein